MGPPKLPGRSNWASIGVSSAGGRLDNPRGQRRHIPQPAVSKCPLLRLALHKGVRARQEQVAPMTGPVGGSPRLTAAGNVVAIAFQ
jgi:hypothetical protein